MEPTSLIIAALVAGATKAAGDIAPDVYNGLKTLIMRKFAGDSTAEMVLEEHKKDPETFDVPLKKKLADTGANKDNEIIEKAQELLKQLEPKESASGKCNIVFQDKVQGMQIGDGNTQTNTFGS